MAFRLPSSRPAALELFDVAGRRLAARNVGGLGAGTHVLDLAERRTLQPGVYFVSLTDGHSTARARAVVIQ